MAELFEEVYIGQSYGQWMGPHKGSNSGLVVLDLDDCADHLRGAAHVFDDNPQFPAIAAFLEGVPTSLEFSMDVDVAPVGPSGHVMTAEQFNAAVPGVMALSKAGVTAKRDGEKLFISWRTNIGTSGSAILEPSRSSNRSDYTSSRGEYTWSEYKDYVVALSEYQYMFRGQPCRNRLRTSFHRTGRSDILRFVREDIPALHRNLSARTSHFFRLADASENGAFYNLVQHHGYPTPLLDWTYSPFVAAYFAFHEFQSSDEPARIFVFDKLNWTKDFNQVQQIAHVKPHFSILEALAIGNERMVPQQALSSVSNIDDIESYIFSKETSDKTYLTVIDLPHSERQKALRELAFMGITAGSLFPGLDGACKELRSRYFGY